MSSGRNGDKRNLVFTYGTLKRGFSNHVLMQDLIAKDDAVYLGDYVSEHELPLVCGPHGVPFLLNIPGSGGHRVRGELYAVSDRGLEPLDRLEGITLGHYERLPIRIRPADSGNRCDHATAIEEAEAYYCHRSFAEKMWRRNGNEGFPVYSENEALQYVKRDARPKDRSFLDDIRSFCSSD